MVCYEHTINLEELRNQEVLRPLGTTKVGVSKAVQQCLLQECSGGLESHQGGYLRTPEPQNHRTTAEMELGRSKYSNLSLFLPPVSFQALLLAEPAQRPESKGDREMPFLGVSPLGHREWIWVGLGANGEYTRPVVAPEQQTVRTTVLV